MACYLSVVVVGRKGKNRWHTIHIHHINIHPRTLVFPHPPNPPSDKDKVTLVSIEHVLTSFPTNRIWKDKYNPK